MSQKTPKKSGAERTQPAVVGEEWDDAKIKSFLELQPRDGEAPDFHILIKAYQGMVPEAFSRFVHFFVEAGHDLNEKNEHGETILDIVSQHRNSAEYAQALEEAGAEKKK